jgi:hypothetical protein
MAMGMLERIASEKVHGLAIYAGYKFVKKRFIARCIWKTLSIEPAHKLKSGHAKVTKL